MSLFRARTRRFAPLALTLSLAAGAVVLATPERAEACGGCFVPPIANTVVAYHRMVLSISTKQTTLYDQIRYSGNPESFAWVLPIRGTANVGVSADLMFAALDQQTQTVWQSPPANCPAPPYCPRPSSDSARSPSFASAGSSADAGVSVLKQETVGPYETVQLQSTNPNALADWLDARGYNIPDDIKPLIATYVSEGFNFLALKLVPGNGVQTMRPVRVTTPGASPSLPLRMVAAGSGATVGVTLWVVGEGRWEPQSFPSFFVPAGDVTWTWQSSSHDYEAIRKAKLANFGDAAWEIESSVDLASAIVPSLLNQQISFQPGTVLPDGGWQPPSIYDPILDEEGNVVKSGQEAQAEDMEALFQNLNTARITRMRSDLPRASLATDLALQASVEQATFSNVRKITREVGEPTCPVYEGCEYVGTAPRTQARERAENQCGSANSFCGGGGGCAIQAPTSARGLAPWAFAALGIIVAGMRSYRRRSQQ